LESDGISPTVASEDVEVGMPLRAETTTTLPTMDEPRFARVLEDRVGLVTVLT
jgi:hypothetical protein